MVWREPIFDRTQEDIDNKTEKAYLNHDDIIRIQDNIEYVANLSGVRVNKITTNFEYGGVPTQSDFGTLLSWEGQIKDAWGMPFNVPTNPINTFTKVNDMERFTFNALNYIESAKTNVTLVHLNEIYSGEDYLW